MVAFVIPVQDGNSSWIFTMEISHNFLINNFSQHLFARARICRGWCHDAHSDMGRCYQLVATLTLRSNTHTQIIPNPSQSSKHLISHDNCKKNIAFESQWVKWKQNWNFRSFKIRKVEALRHFDRLPTAPAMSDGDVYVVHDVHVSPVFEPSSLWSMSPLSSLCRMETVPGFSPWKLVIPHCGTPCLVFNFPINNFSQHLFARARNCRGWCHDAYSDMGRCYQFVATLTLRGNTHTQIIPNPSQSSKHLISHDNCKKHLAFQSQWVKWKQNWNFRSFKIRKVELLHHLGTLPIAPAMSVDSCPTSWYLDWTWFAVVHVSFVFPVQDGNSSWIFTMEISHTALWNAMLSIQLSNQQLFSAPFSLWSMMSVFFLFWKVRRSGQAVYNSSIVPHGGVHASKNQAKPDCPK